MSDLAYNINGEGFEPPETTTGWRVRRMKPRGAPEVVYGRDGLPLIISIESDLEELRQNIDSPGRFRLDAVDDRGRTVEGAQPAYVVVSQVGDDDAKTQIVAAPKATSTEHALIEAMRLNTELARSVIDKFPNMMTAAAELLRAADGAGLPRREPHGAPEGDDTEGDDDAPAQPVSSSFELINTLVAQIVPLIVTNFANKKGPKLGAILDWRKAVPEKPANEPGRESSTPTTAQAEQSEPAELAALDPRAMTHFIAIQAALTPAEAALARQVAADLSPAEVRTWLGELSALSVPDAVAKIRTFIGAKSGGAS